MDKTKYTEPFSHPRWKDIPHPRIIGEEEITPEEEEKSKKTLITDDVTYILME